MTAPAETTAPHTDPAAPRPASSLVLLRDGPGGLEVLLLQRPAEDRVLAGAHVFPGGKLDAEDAHDDLLNRIDASPQALHARLSTLSLDPCLAPGPSGLREDGPEQAVRRRPRSAQPRHPNSTLVHQ